MYRKIELFVIFLHTMNKEDCLFSAYVSQAQYIQTAPFRTRND